jgi:GntR family transcriptional regulator
MDEVRDAERAAFRRAVAARETGETKQSEARRVYALMRTAIRAGLVGAGESLVEATLMRQFATTRNSVRGALVQLSDDGLVERGPRIGTTVRDAFRAVELGLIQASDSRLTIENVFTQVVRGSPVIRSLLHLPENSKVSMAEYTIHRDGVPFCVETCYWAPEVSPRIPFIADDGDDLPSSFARHFGKPLQRSETSVEAIQGDSNTTELMCLPPKAPLLLSEKVLFDTDDVPRELQYIYYAASRTYFRASTQYIPS